MDVNDALAQATIKVQTKLGGFSPSLISSEQMTTANPLVVSFFKVEPTSVDNKMANKLSEIYDWAKKQAGENDQIKILEVLRDVKFRLGSPDINTSHIDHVHRYIKLRGLARDYETEAKAMEQ